jgi:hypothetical protein
MSIDNKDLESKFFQQVSKSSGPIILNHDRSNQEKEASARKLNYEADQEKEKLIFMIVGRYALGAIIGLMIGAGLAYFIMALAKICFK